MSQVMKSKIVTVSIEAPVDVVYSFASDPANFPQWAPSFAHSIALVNDRWVVQTTDGPMNIRFVAKNDFGILDHYVRLAPGLEIYNPVRVIANGEGSEVIFTLFQRPDMSEEEHAEDAKSVEGDLLVLKRVVEARSGG
jgi:hypothetical protein